MRKVIFAFIFFLFAAILGSTTVFTDLRQNVLAGYLRFMVVSTLLTSAVVLISMEIEHSKVLEWVGSHSLQILVLHKFPVLFFQSLCPYIKELISAGNIIAEFVVALLTIGISGACIAVIEKYIPWLFVRKRNLNEKNKLY